MGEERGNDALCFPLSPHLGWLHIAPPPPSCSRTRRTQWTWSPHGVTHTQWAPRPAAWLSRQSLLPTAGSWADRPLCLSGNASDLQNRKQSSALQSISRFTVSRCGKTGLRRWKKSAEWFLGLSSCCRIHISPLFSLWWTNNFNEPRFKTFN